MHFAAQHNVYLSSTVAKACPAWLQTATQIKIKQQTATHLHAAIESAATAVAAAQPAATLLLLCAPLLRHLQIRRQGAEACSGGKETSRSACESCKEAQRSMPNTGNNV